MAKIGIVEVGDIISYQLPAETNFLPVVDYEPACFFSEHIMLFPGSVRYS